MRVFIAGILIFHLTSCVPDNSGVPSDIRAYVPIYIQKVDTAGISMEASRSTLKAGKIYAWGNYIFQNEERAGIHIIDNSNPAHPVKTGFLNIASNTEFAVRGTYIYANQLSDLLVINIQDPMHPVLLKRIKDAFPSFSQQYPPFSGPFVCPDPSKGIVVGWELKLVDHAACRK